jgi:putative flippase GtrA
MRKFAEKCILLFRYSAVGVLAFILELGMLYALLRVLSAPYYVSVAIAFVVSIVLQYAATHAWVFEYSGRRMRIEFFYFGFILITGLALTIALVMLFVTEFHMNVVAARTISGIFTGLWDFYLNARFNFRARTFLRRD